MRKHVPAVLAALVLSGLATPAMAAGAGAEPPGLDAAFREQVLRHRPTGRLQVRFKDGVGAVRREAALAQVAARGLSLRVDARIGGLNAAILSVSDARAVQTLLRDHPDVAYVEPESRYKAFQTEPVSAELKEIGADAAHSAATPNTGVGTQIAVLDSPVDSANSDLDNGKVVFTGDFTTEVPAHPDDPFKTVNYSCTAAACPHGTAVAAAAAAQAGDGNVAGVAPGASIRSYNVFRRFVYTNPDNSTQKFEVVGASSADIAAALVGRVGQPGVLAHAKADPSLVAVNMSLGGPFDNQLVKDAIAKLHAEAPRVAVIVAAGNDGGERANFPAGDPHVLSVGATGQVTGDRCDVTVDPATPWTVASFSNRGDVDVVAPGHCLGLWYPQDNPDTGAVVPGTTAVRKVSGTSFAAPMVAGVAALLAAAPKPLVGDAARAAIIAGAARPATPNINLGAGAAKAPAALELAAGTTPFSALSLARGGQVASVVGRRDYEVLSVDPTGATPTAPVPTVTSGFGSVTAGTTSAAAGIARRYGRYSVPAAAKTGSFRLTAGATVVPMKMLDAGNNYEGLPGATGETWNVPLTYGSRSAYIRSAAVNDQSELAYAFRFDPHGWQTSADLFMWEPAADGLAADAAMEPLTGHYGMENPDTLSGVSSVIPGYDLCAQGRTCNRGRWLIGWIAFSPGDSSSSSTYGLRFSYAAPTVSLTTPAIASATSAAGPFGVTWGGNTRATRFDVSYATKVKSGTTWVTSAYKPWKTNTTAKSGVFGSSGSPTTVVPGTTYYIRVVSYDALRNPSVVLTKATAAPLDDRSTSIAYSTGTKAWGNVAASDRWKGTAKRTSAAGATAVLSASASSFSIVGDRCSTCGQVKVYVDGVYKATVDTYRSTSAVRQTLWSSGALSGGIKARSIKLVVVGTKGRPKVVLDGIATVR